MSLTGNSVLLKDLPADETKVNSLDLLKTMDPNDVQNEKSRGQITLELTYKPFKEEDMEKEGTEGTDEIEKAPDGTPAGGGLLYVIVHEAQDLEGKHHTNPYAKIIFKGEEKKTKETLGYIDISLADVVSNKRINEKYHLIDSKNGQVQIELQWRTS
nr:unnamed protein product [Digitaria exilis]